jgi:hypothetical protein
MSDRGRSARRCRHMHPVVPEDRHTDRRRAEQVIGRAGDKEDVLGCGTERFERQAVGAEMRLVVPRPLGGDDDSEGDPDPVDRHVAQCFRAVGDDCQRDMPRQRRQHRLGLGPGCQLPIAADEPVGQEFRQPGLARRLADELLIGPIRPHRIGIPQIRRAPWPALLGAARHRVPKRGRVEECCQQVEENRSGRCREIGRLSHYSSG